MVAVLVGAVLGIGVGLFGTSTGLDRDPAFYPVTMIVTASYYALFAVLGGSSHALALEVLAGVVFLALAVAGFKSSLWLVAGALVAHAIFDLVRGSVINNPGVPSWWPPFCLSLDLALAAYLAWLLVSGRRRGSAAG